MEVYVLKVQKFHPQLARTICHHLSHEECVPHLLSMLFLPESCTKFSMPRDVLLPYSKLKVVKFTKSRTGNVKNFLSWMQNPYKP